jgi:hypothetical protein
MAHGSLSILFRDSANRMQSSLLGIAEVQPILCKDSASRMQSSLLGIAEVQPILCKDNTLFSNNTKYIHIFFIVVR